MMRQFLFFKNQITRFSAHLPSVEARVLRLGWKVCVVCFAGFAGVCRIRVLFFGGDLHMVFERLNRRLRKGMIEEEEIAVGRVNLEAVCRACRSIEAVEFGRRGVVGGGL